MSINAKPYRKPNLLLLVTCFVGLAFVLTSVTQAAEPANSEKTLKVSNSERTGSQGWLRSLWSLDLASKLQNWKPKVRPDTGGKGVKLSRPFGHHGPSLRLSASIPQHARDSLRAGGDNQVGSVGGDMADAYLFLHKRW